MLDFYSFLSSRLKDALFKCLIFIAFFSLAKKVEKWALGRGRRALLHTFCTEKRYSVHKVDILYRSVQNLNDNDNHYHLGGRAIN